MPHLAGKPVLLVASGRGSEAASNRTYRDAAGAGAGAALWVIGDVGHTAGLRAHPQEYERRTVGFLDHAL